MKTLEELETLVIEWANDRNIIKGSTTPHQFMKLSEEFGELSLAVLLTHKPFIKDGIGDFVVVLINIAAQLNIDGGVSTCRGRAMVANWVVSDMTGIVTRLSAELGDLAGAIIRDREYRASVSIGNCLLLAEVLAKKAEVGSLEDCLAAAYEEIKDREGEMVENVWVKKADLGG